MKRLILISALVSLVFISCKQDQSSAPDLKAVELSCEMLKDPVGIDAPNPRLSWKLQTEARGVRQTAYRLMVASSEEKLAVGQADVWDSGKQNSDASILIPYAGPELRSSRYYYWKVQIWTNANKEAVESETARWATGLFTENDWKNSRWIGLDGPMPWDVEKAHARLSARYYRNEFNCAKPVRQALVHISGLGLYELWINGGRIGNHVMTPAPTDYRRSILYNSYDVTSSLQQGQNALGVIVGNGRYYAMRQNYKPYKWANFGYPKLRMILNIEYEDGTRQTIGSNERWMMTADGPIISNNELDGEEYDARKEFPGWTEVGFKTGRNWFPAQRVTIPTAVIRAQPNPEMKVSDVFHPQSITKINKNTYILDMGQNMTGWIRMKVKGNAGHEVKLRFAEILQEDGSLSMANLRDAMVTDKYILKGDPQGEEWAPIFTTHGFRYVELSNYPGEPKPENFIGEFVSDEMEDLGYFESSSEVLNGIVRNAYWGIKGNYKGMPIDCPQRNERMPWLGDRTIGAYGESFLLENDKLYAKWMDDIREAQRWDGSIPDVAPAYWNYYSDDVTWPAAFFFISEMLYRQFGDLRPIEKNYESMKLFMEHMRRHYLKDGLLVADKYGDWCMPPEAPEIIHSKDPSRITEGALISTAYFYKLYHIMSGFANLLNKPEDSMVYLIMAQDMKTAFNRHFYNSENQYYGNNTVTANLLPLAFDLVPAEARKGVEENVQKTLLETYGGTMATGVIGGSWLMRELTAMGRGDIAFLLASTTKQPSWGYMLTKGATTIWELWNGDTAAPSMNSGNHVMLLGDLLIWCFENLAGISSDTEQVAYKRIVMKPDFGIADLNFINASYKTPYGLVVSIWKNSEGYLDWSIKVPANASALVCLPVVQKKNIKESDRPISSSRTIRYLGTENNGTLIELGSGEYHLNVQL